MEYATFESIVPIHAVIESWVIFVSFSVGPENDNQLHSQ